MHPNEYVIHMNIKVHSAVIDGSGGGGDVAFVALKFSYSEYKL